MNEVNPLSDEEVAALSIEDQAIRPSIINLQAVTLRALDKFDLNSIKAERCDGWNLIGKKYLNP
ncbi:hypothetical protein N7475_006610 [Penicillium sp. IBT 31633x]|nr:hypothetical protein N7475_006610 [Penicillium sp. IBT 31633x]